MKKFLLAGAIVLIVLPVTLSAQKKKAKTVNLSAFVQKSQKHTISYKKIGAQNLGAKERRKH